MSCSVRVEIDYEHGLVRLKMTKGYKVSGESREANAAATSASLNGGYNLFPGGSGGGYGAASMDAAAGMSASMVKKFGKVVSAVN